MKYSFRNDYSEGCHPAIIEAIKNSNHGQCAGYGEDEYCEKAGDILKNLIGKPSADVHFLTSGTQTNMVMISAALRPHESVIATDMAHISTHEAGAVESTGHKINEVPTKDGKLSPENIENVVAEHFFEHMVHPKMVFISNTTEAGTVYTKKELHAIRETCDKHNLLLYIDGARLGMAMTSPVNDISLPELASLADAFYVGGTKNGFMMGEALVIVNDSLKPFFRYHLKQKGALLAKGRFLGIQFISMFENNLYFDLAEYANLLAAKLSNGIAAAGFNFCYVPESNQIFPILPDHVIKTLEQDFGFYVWEKTTDTDSCIRLVLSWAGSDQQVEAFINDLNHINRR
ncbi:MAG: threonine aldolase family protein [Bacteroidota bacterium]